MKQHTIQPFYFPTTVVFVDDSAPFLANLSLQLDPHLAFKLFHSPFAALSALNHEHAATPIDSDFFSLYAHREDARYADHIIQMSLDKVHREVHNEHRFEQVSVVVVDYDMPEMNGLEFCRQLKNPNIKKILLTGKADEQIAVQAFNAKTIDHFIRKQDNGAMALLNHTIVKLQQEYFQHMAHMLSRALSVGSHVFLRDPTFAQRVYEIQQQLGIVEHYLTCAPNGILMLDATGNTYLLLVQDAASMQEVYEIAYDQVAPDELLTKLRSGRYLPYFWKTEGHYATTYSDWQTYLHAATEVQSENAYIYAVIQNPEGFNRSYVVSYNDYLERLDHGTIKQSPAAV
jgi:CheY-like chemotaxis protein